MITDMVQSCRVGLRSLKDKLPALRAHNLPGSGIPAPTMAAANKLQFAVLTLQACTLRLNTGSGLAFADGYSFHASLHGSLFAVNAGSGISVDGHVAKTRLIAEDCTVFGSASHGIHITVSSPANCGIVVTPQLWKIRLRL